MGVDRDFLLFKSITGTEYASTAALGEADKQ